MKILFKLLPAFFVAGVVLLSGYNAHAQPPLAATPAGDNFDLNAATTILATTASLAEYEAMINSSKSKINNVDLNEDGKLDYLKVVEVIKERTNLISIQAITGKDAAMGLATIEIHSFTNGAVSVVTAGNGALYGEKYYLTPNADSDVVSRGVASVLTQQTTSQIQKGTVRTAWVSDASWNNYPDGWKAEEVLDTEKYRMTMKSMYPKIGSWSSAARRASKDREKQ